MGGSPAPGDVLATLSGDGHVINEKSTVAPHPALIHTHTPYADCNVSADPLEKYLGPAAAQKDLLRDQHRQLSLGEWQHSRTQAASKFYKNQIEAPDASNS